MKKILAFLLAAVLAASCVACQSGGDTSSAAGGNASDTTSQADTSWDKVKEKGKLVLGLDDAFPPMGYVDEATGDLVGFDIDVAKEVCKRLEIELELQPIDWNNKTAEMSNGNVDCLWNGFSWTEERDQEFNLSTPYMKNNQIILVKADSSYDGLASLAGKTIGVQADSSAESALNSDENADFKNSLAQVVQIDDYAKAVLEIQNGTIDAIAIDEVVARFYLKNNPGAYKVLQEAGKDATLAVEDYVIGFRKGEDALKEKVEGTLKEMADDGTLTKISEQWFETDVTTVGK